MVNNKFSSITIGLLLFVTIVLPSFVLMIFSTKSMAAGLFIIIVIHILIASFSNSIRRKIGKLINELTLIIMIMCTVMIHGMTSFIWHDNFNLLHFFYSYAFFLIFLFGASMFLQSAKELTKKQVDFALKFVFYMLLICAFFGVLKISPFTLKYPKPVVFYIEPSHFALDFLPFLLYMVLSNLKKFSTIFNLSLLCFFTLGAILLQSLTLLVGIALICVISMPLKNNLFFLIIMSSLVLLKIKILTYFSSYFSLTNLSTLVFLSGFERIYFNLKKTFGFGLGFQQLGALGVNENKSNNYLTSVGLHDLNLYDGGFVAVKLISEFGLLGITLIIFYLLLFFKIVMYMRKMLLSNVKYESSLDIFFLSCYVMYSIDLFFRGTGYFSSTGFLFVASLMWLFSRKPIKFV